MSKQAHLFDEYPDWYIQLRSDVLAQMPPAEELARDAALVWHENQATLRWELRSLFLHPPIKDFASEDFVLRIGGERSLENLIAAGEYVHYDPRVKIGNVRISQSLSAITTLRLIGFPKVVSTEFVLTEAEKQGLKRPTCEHALCFGEQYPDLQKSHVIVFLHDPLRDPLDDCERIIALGMQGGNERVLFLKTYRNTFEYHVHDSPMNYRFAFVAEGS